MALDPGRTVAELRELRELTGDDEGAQRVAWTDTWVQAKKWLASKLEPLGVEEEIDEAGNQWFTLPGASPRANWPLNPCDSITAALRRDRQAAQHEREDDAEEQKLGARAGERDQEQREEDVEDRQHHAA